MSRTALMSKTAQQELWDNASRVKSLTRIKLPRLESWNYDPCPEHEAPTAECQFRACGFDPFDHQTLSAGYFFAAKKGIDASQTGTGKTNSILLTLCLAKHFGEPLKAVIVVPTTAVHQWAAETKRFAPGLKATVATSDYNKPQRIDLYAGDWEVLIIGFHLMTRDIGALEVIAPRQVISDDVDPILQMKNATHKAMVRLCSHADRVIVANATNLQTRLNQLYAASALIGGRQVWGSPTAFDTRYIKREPVYIHTKLSAECAKCDGKGCGSCGNTGKLNKGKDTKKVYKAVGHKNIDDFKRKFTPMMIRHRYEDLTDLRIPEIVSENVYLELHPAQRDKYNLLQKGVLELQKKDMPTQQKKVTALAAWTHGGQICAGLPALGEADGPGASVKLDWTVERLSNDWLEEKVVVYARNRGTISALQSRLDGHGIGHAAIWGGLTGVEARAEEVRRFWEDPDCKTMILSAAGERSLNLQNASAIVSIDMNLNPARVMQILGRVRRIGSTKERVFAINLLANETQESRYMLALASRQILFDAIHDESNSEMFETLEPETILQLISP